MSLTERQKMMAGDWYTCINDELHRLRSAARRAVHEHNTSDPDRRGGVSPGLRSLLGAVGKDVFIEAPFHCAYGYNIRLGDGVYVNAGAAFLDTAAICIGARSMLGPGAQIYCADHHRDPVLRGKGLEIARPVLIGEDVWIGGGAIILPGVTIGARAIIGAGSVVVRDVAEGATVVGNSARPVTRGPGTARP